MRPWRRRPPASLNINDGPRMWLLTWLPSCPRSSQPQWVWLDGLQDRVNGLANGTCDLVVAGFRATTTREVSRAGSEVPHLKEGGRSMPAFACWRACPPLPAAACAPLLLHLPRCLLLFYTPPVFSQEAVDFVFPAYYLTGALLDGCSGGPDLSRVPACCCLPAGPQCCGWSGTASGRAHPLVAVLAAMTAACHPPLMATSEHATSTACRHLLAGTALFTPEGVAPEGVQTWEELRGKRVAALAGFDDGNSAEKLGVELVAVAGAEGEAGGESWVPCWAGHAQYGIGRAAATSALVTCGAVQRRSALASSSHPPSCHALPSPDRRGGGSHCLRPGGRLLG